MKNLNKKIGVVVLSGLMLVGGSGLSGLSALSAYAEVVPYGEHSKRIDSFLSKHRYQKPKWFEDKSDAPSEWVNSHESDRADVEGGKNIYGYEIVRHEQIKNNFPGLPYKEPSEEFPDYGKLAVDYLKNMSNKPLSRDLQSSLEQSSLIIAKDGSAFFEHLKKKGNKKGIQVFVVGRQLYVLKFNSVLKPNIDVYDHIDKLAHSEERNFAQVYGFQKVFDYWVVDHGKDEEFYKKFKDVKLYQLKDYENAEELIYGFLFKSERPKDGEFYKVKVGNEYYVICFKKIDFQKSYERILKKYGIINCVIKWNQ